MSDTLVVNEIYLSLQGESTFAGLPCIFVRLTACNLRCSYCDTAYAFTEGKKMVLEEVREKVRRLAAPFQAHSAISLAPGFSPVADELRNPAALAACRAHEAVETASLSSHQDTGMKPGANEIGNSFGPRAPLVEL